MSLVVKSDHTINSILLPNKPIEKPQETVGTPSFLTNVADYLSSKVPLFTGTLCVDLACRAISHKALQVSLLSSLMLTPLISLALDILVETNLESKESSKALAKAWKEDDFISKAALATKETVTKTWLKALPLVSLGAMYLIWNGNVPSVQAVTQTAYALKKADIHLNAWAKTAATCSFAFPALACAILGIHTTSQILNEEPSPRKISI